MINAKSKKRQRKLMARWYYIILVVEIVSIIFINCLKNSETEERENTEEVPYARCCYISDYEIEQTRRWLESRCLEPEDISCVNSKPMVLKSEIVEISSLTESEYELLCKLVHAESGRKSSDEMVAIAATVLNRVENEKFPNDITSVIFEERQFSTARDGNIYWYPVADEKAVLHFSEVSEKVKESVNKAIDGENPTKVMVTDGALFFYSEKYISEEEMAKREGRIKEFVKYGDTVFYREYSD